MTRDRVVPWAAGAALILLAGLFALPLLRDGIYVGNGTDLFSYQYPARALLRRLLFDFEFPFWNEGVLGGVPLFAAWQHGVLDPITWLSLPLPSTVAIDLDRALRGVVLVLGAMALGNVLSGASGPRRWLQPSRGAVACAAVFAGAGVTWGHVYAGHLSFLAVWAYVPWWAATTLWAMQPELSLRLRARRAVLAGVPMALCLLAGHPQLVYIAGVTLTFVALAHRAAAGWLGTLVVGAVCASVGLGLSAVQWLPVAELAPELNRSLAGSEPLALSFSPPVAALLTGPAPLAFGPPEARLGSFSWHEAVGAISPAAVALALVGVASLGRRGLWLLGAMIVLLLLVPGRHLPVLQALLDVVPGLDAFRVPSRWWAGVTILVGVAAIPALSAGSTTDNRKLAALLAGLWALGLLGLAFGLDADGSGWYAEAFGRRADAAARAAAESATGGRLTFGAAIAALTAWWAFRGRPQQSWLVLVLLAACVWDGVELGRTVQPAERQWPVERVDWDEATTDWLRQAVGSGRLVTAPRLRHANRPGGAGLRGAGGYETAMPLWSNRFGNLANGRPVDRYQVNLQIRRASPWLDRMAVNHLLVDGRDRPTIGAFPGWRRAGERGTLQLLRSPSALPRVALAERTEVVADRSEALLRLGRLGRDTVLVDRAVSAQPRVGSDRVVPTVTRNAEQAFEVTVASPALLVVRDALTAGWQAEVDGTAAPWVLVDGLFRGVEVPAGTHHVEMRYIPPGWLLGLALSLLTFFAALAALRLLREPDQNAEA